MALPELPKGYVEPEPEFYARIAALVGMTRDGLVSRGLLEKPQDNNLSARVITTPLTTLRTLRLT